MKASEMRDMTKEELQKELEELKSELFKLRFQLVTNQLDNPMKLKACKKNIARVKTVLKEMEIKAAQA